jgi:hypothetical protein
MFDLYRGTYPVWLCVGAPVIPGFFWSSLQLHTRRDILNQSFFIHCLATKLNSVILLFVFLSFQYIQVYSTAFPNGWLGNIQKMFVCCTYSIGSPKVGDSPTWGTERVEFVHRKCFDKNSSDWETWFYIKANFFFFYGFFPPILSQLYKESEFCITYAKGVNNNLWTETKKCWTVNITCPLWFDSTWFVEICTYLLVFLDVSYLQTGWYVLPHRWLRHHVRPKCW